jgi:hypothetical protein
VLFLPDGGGPGTPSSAAGGAAPPGGVGAAGGSGDGQIWTVKSMDRSPAGYLLTAYYGMGPARGRWSHSDAAYCICCVARR